MFETRICKNCNEEFSIELFPKHKTNSGFRYERQCKKCKSDYNKKYREDNKVRLDSLRMIWLENNREAISINNRDYYINNKDSLLIKNKIYYQENKEFILDQAKIYQTINSDKIKNYKRSYFQKNKDVVIKKQNERNKKRENNDPSFKIRKRISSQIRDHLKRFGSSKNGNSILNFLDYSIDDLRSHLESLFESWMTWGNYGPYNSVTWNDNNSTTWTWNIDHIIPQYKLSYSSMNEDNFKKCWALENLRPYSSKQNNLDGAKRIR